MVGVAAVAAVADEAGEGEGGGGAEVEGVVVGAGEEDSEEGVE